MASSNRHWPSLFKSKACNSHHQWQHDITPPPSLLNTSAACQKPPYSSAPSCEDRTPEPKPRWNPKPEQIRILEAIFNSGMVNPPRDEIRRIRIKLQEYGQVGDANVFYWFQNRKSRSKHKQRLSTKSRSASLTATVATSCTAASSSSSSSERSTSAGSDKASLLSKTLASAATLADFSNSPTASVNQSCFERHSAHGEFSGEPFFFPDPPAGYCMATSTEQASLVFAPEQGLGLCSGLWGDLLSTTTAEGYKSGVLDQAAAAAKAKMQLHYICGTAATTTEHAAASTTSATLEAARDSTAITTAAPTIASPVGDILLQGMGGPAAAAAAGGVPSRFAVVVVFINEVAFQVATEPINVKEAFGEEAVLLHSSGQPVLVDEWGITLLPLQHGASYYLV